MPYTLATLHDRVEVLLRDADNVRYDASLVDQAIWQALDAYSERMPARQITTVEVTAHGREIDISSVPYGTIERVWWDYDEEEPGHPPRWCDFELWPGDLLYIVDGEEPAPGDVVRIWTAAPHTLAGLDGAPETTLPAAHISLIAQGAAAFAVLARRVEIDEAVNDNAWAPRNLERWAEAQLKAYYRRLDELARRAAARASGLAPGPILDRWDAANTW
jgi:hypothetical protein